MSWYIRSKRDGYFVGECLGLGFFEVSIWDGTLNPEEEIAEFLTRREAMDYLSSWIGGMSDCFVTSEPPKSEKYKPPRLKKKRYAPYHNEGRNEVADFCLPWDEMQWGM